MSPIEAREGVKVWLNGSDYRVAGVIVSAFTKYALDLRYHQQEQSRVVVQCLEPAGLLLIANPLKCDHRE